MNTPKAFANFSPGVGAQREPWDQNINSDVTLKGFANLLTLLRNYDFKGLAIDELVTELPSLALQGFKDASLVFCGVLFLPDIDIFLAIFDGAVDKSRQLMSGGGDGNFAITFGAHATGIGTERALAV